MRILIVEDDQHYLLALSAFAERMGMRFDSATTFSEARTLIESTPYDLVITDFNFPGGDGDTIVELARRFGIPRVFLNSGMPDQSKRLKHFDRVLDKMDIQALKVILAEAAQK